MESKLIKQKDLILLDLKVLLALEGYNVRYEDGYTLILSLDELTNLQEVKEIIMVTTRSINKYGILFNM